MRRRLGPAVTMLMFAFLRRCLEVDFAPSRHEHDFLMTFGVDNQALANEYALLFHSKAARRIDAPLSDRNTPITTEPKAKRMTILRIAAFSDGDIGGNPAGVWLGDALPAAADMQAMAAAVGFSETVFAAPEGNVWRVRYFSPEIEVPFCGHATIALGAALALRHGNRTFALKLNRADISVTGQQDGPAIAAALQSPPTRSEPLDAELKQELLTLFSYADAELDMDIPPARIHGGADHAVLALRSREALASMRYDFERGRALMERAGLVTIALVTRQTPQLFHVRNAFAGGGVFEDPATGAAAAAFAGYLRDIAWPHGGAITLVQGEDMGQRSLIHAEIGALSGSSIRVSGAARVMDA